MTRVLSSLPLASLLTIGECSFSLSDGCWGDTSEAHESADTGDASDTDTAVSEPSSAERHLVEICYSSGTDLSEGELYLSGPDICAWEDPADVASAGDLFLCVVVDTKRGDEFVLNATFTEEGSDTTAQATSCDDPCDAVDWTGTVYVATVPVTTETIVTDDSCASGPAAAFQIP